ncbi:hypothetical protein NUW54_g8702 [Trametes sanguinea]|uniref:Uncharacterized protein n=1 Tax=Trametes sanguinea TaxID=158606 RepID=A0ACC1PE54_9APHY|nr:hypothetical protein NUW54_g8702 [Trametes sanguinea]
MDGRVDINGRPKTAQPLSRSARTLKTGDGGGKQFSLAFAIQDRKECARLYRHKFRNRQPELLQSRLGTDPRSLALAAHVHQSSHALLLSSRQSHPPIPPSTNNSSIAVLCQAMSVGSESTLTFHTIEEIDQVRPLRNRDGGVLGTALWIPQYSAPGIYARLTKTFQSGVTRPLEYRRRQLLQLARMVQDNHTAFEDALIADLNKPRVETTVAEVSHLVTAVMNTVANFEEWALPQPCETKEAWRSSWGATLYKEPKGIVLIISPLRSMFRFLHCRFWAVAPLPVELPLLISPHLASTGSWASLLIRHQHKR